MNRKVLYFLVFCCSLVLAGCGVSNSLESLVANVSGNSSDHNALVSSTMTNKTFPLFKIKSVRWEISLPFRDFLTDPVVCNGTVYVGGNDGLYAYDAATGTLKWKYPTPGDPTGIAVSQGRIYLGVNTGTGLYVVNASSGKLDWRYDTGGEVEYNPLVDGNMVYVASYNESTEVVNMYGLNVETEEPKWVFTDSNPTEISSQPMLNNGLLFLPLSSGLDVIDPTTGQKVWNNQDCILFNQAAWLRRGRIYFSISDRLEYIDVHTKQVTTVGIVPTINAMAAGNNAIYYTTMGSDPSAGIYAITDSDKLIWHDAIGACNNGTQIVIRGNYIYLSNGSSLYAIDANNGNIMWTKVGVNGNPVIVGNDLYLLSISRNTVTAPDGSWYYPLTLLDLSN